MVWGVMMFLLLLACADDAPPIAPPPPLTKVRVVLNWYPEPEFGGFYEAELSGAYDDAGLDVTIIPGGPGSPVMELLEGGSAEVAISGADDLLLRRSRGLTAVAILPAFQDSPVGLMVHAEGGPTRFEDVRGRVAIEAGSPFQQFLWAKYGWAGKVEMVPTTGSIGPFAADPTLIQQAYITSEPCLAKTQGIATRFLPGRDAGWNPYASLAVVRDAQAPWVKAFHEASMAGWKGYLADPTRANTEIARLNPDMPMSRMDCVVKRQAPYVTGTDGLGAMTKARWDEAATALSTTGTKVDAAGAWVSL